MRAYVFFFIFHFFLFPSRRMSCFRPTQRHKPTRAHYPHNSAPPTAQSDGFRPDWWPPSPAAGTPSAAVKPAAAAAAAAPATAAPVPAIDPSLEESKDNASELLAGGFPYPSRIPYNSRFDSNTLNRLSFRGSEKNIQKWVRLSRLRQYLETQTTYGPQTWQRRLSA